MKQLRPMGRSGLFQARPQDEISFRSNRTYTQYNVNDFLPPSRINTRSQATPTPTEPSEPHQNQGQTVEVEKMRKRLELVDEQRKQLKKQLESAQEREKAQEQKILSLENTNKELLGQIQEMRKKKTGLGSFSMSPVLVMPRYRQSYEVSVQTEPETVPTLSHQPMPVHEKEPSKLSATGYNGGDREMQDIYRKLQSLKMKKRVSSTQERAWPGQDKQNNMGFLNREQPVTGNKKRISRQTIDVFSIEESRLEQLLGDYFG